MARDLLAETIEHKVLQSVELVSGKLKRNGIGDLEALGLPSEVTRVGIKGKLILVELASGGALTSTLGMSGWWYPHISQVRPEVLERGKSYYNGRTRNVSDVLDAAFKHERVRLTATTGEVACYVDPRNFGNMQAWSKDELEADHPFNRLGFDLLNEYPASAQAGLVQERMSELYDALMPRLGGRRLGDLCLDQEAFAGLGNIYRAETLYLCGLSPYTKLKRLSRERFFGLLSVGAFVLTTAYAHQGTMMYPVEIFTSVQHPSAIARLAADRGVATINRHLVYGHQQDPVGHPVIADRAFGRAMWWCPDVQAEA